MAEKEMVAAGGMWFTGPWKLFIFSSVLSIPNSSRSLPFHTSKLDLQQRFTVISHSVWNHLLLKTSSSRSDVDWMKTEVFARWWVSPSWFPKRPLVRGERQMTCVTSCLLGPPVGRCGSRTQKRRVYRFWEYWHHISVYHHCKHIDRNIKTTPEGY